MNGCWFLTLGFVFAAVLSAGEISVPAEFPTESSAWEFFDTDWPFCAVSDVLYYNGEFWMIGSDCTTTDGKFHVAKSENGVDNWEVVAWNVISYDHDIPKTDGDWYVFSSAIGKNPDGTPAMYEGKFVQVFCNFEGNDSDIKWALSDNLIDWEVQGFTDIDDAPGSDDPGEQWITSLIRHDDGTWYQYFHGGGWPGGRTICLATGETPGELDELSHPIVEPDWREGDQAQGALIIRDRPVLGAPAGVVPVIVTMCFSHSIID